MARHGENIHKRKDGRWEARIIVGRNSANKAVYRSVYGRTYEEVKAEKDKYRMVDDQYVYSSLTFDEAALQWLLSKKGKIKKNTYNHYENQYNLHIKPVFKDRQIIDLKTEDYDHFIMSLEEDGFAPSTVILLRTIIKMILKYTKKNYQIPLPEDIYIPKKPRRQVEAFTRSEQAMIDQYLMDHMNHYALAVLFSLYCGLRIGEVCALQWQDVNLVKGVVHVTKTLIRIQVRDGNPETKTAVITGKPKTESSNRTVPIPDRLVQIITSNFSDSPEYYVITGEEHWMEPRVCLRKFKKIVSELNMEEYTFHACRHTYATRCIELGMDAKILSELLGHASVKTTLDRYVHPSLDYKKEQVNKLSVLSSFTQ